MRVGKNTFWQGTSIALAVLLGVGSSFSVAAPALALNQPGLITSPQIAAGADHTCVVESDAALKCWGLNDNGQIDVPTDLGPVSQVSPNGYLTCALTMAGLARCWGDNSFGQATVPADMGKVTQVSAGFLQACALTLAGVVRCWGDNRFGETNVPSDLGQVAQVSSGAAHTCALNVAGYVRCWGFNSYGETNVPDDLGQVTQISTGTDHACALTIAGAVRCWGYWNGGATDVPKDLGAVTQISTGQDVSCAVTTEAAVVCWGGNHGEIDVPSDLGSVTQISTGAYHACALTNLGVMRCWGTKDYGQINVPSGLNLKRPLTKTPAPLVTGSYFVGSVLSADAGSWDQGAALTYQWKRNGVSISGASDSTYQLQSSDFGSQISVEVSGSLKGYFDSTQLSTALEVSAGDLSSTPEPYINGFCKVGSTLTASAGVWDQGVDLTYQWLRDGAVIVGATLINLELTPADVDRKISVRVRGAKDGYLTTARTSASTAPVAAATMALTPTPSLVGAATVGQTLTGSAGGWDSGVALTYKWLRAGSAISGATAATYVLTAADVGAAITLTVTGSKTGFVTVAKTSNPTAKVVAAVLTLTPVPTITGSPIFGQKLTAAPGLWDSGVTLSYVWKRAGVVITGATSASYTLSAPDLAATITVAVTGTKTGYVSVTKVSAATSIVGSATLTLTPVPAITGTTKVGKVLTAKPGTWDSGVTVSYKWFASGVAIKGATAATYKLAKADSGKKITVSVTATKLGFTSVTKTSVATGKVSP